MGLSNWPLVFIVSVPVGFVLNVLMYGGVIGPITAAYIWPVASVTSVLWVLKKMAENGSNLDDIF